MTTFIVENGNEGNQFQVPIDEADAYQTKIENASWTTLNNLWNLEGTTVIKESA